MVEPSGHYTMAIRRGDWLFVAGQTGEDAAGHLGDLAEQTAQAIANIADIVHQHGGTLSDVVRMTCFLTDITQFEIFNAAYSRALDTHAPARSAVGITGLPAGELIEIEATAYLPLR